MATSFRVGDLVRVRQNERTLLPGIHEVVEVVDPVTGRERAYRVRASGPAPERTVPERRLRRA